MCGIAGFYGEGDEDTLERMSETLARRGPDDAGIWKHKNIGLAHTRLSIIDLSSAGHQPMTSSTGKTSIVFNGEIYNYREIKKEIRESYKFGSSTDTEVILALYEERGVKAFESLNGMFAFALYDHGTATLYLVRDRMGKKPLYWGVFDGTLIFGSELKALMQHEKFKKEIDPEAVRTYLVYECVPTPLSIFKGVRKVRAGEYVAFLGGKEPREESFWNLKREPLNITFTEALAVLDKKIVSAVERRLESDVPLGVFLSGGLDSSTISWYAQKASAAPVNTFSIGFTDKDFDESRYAHAVAGKLGVHHTMEVFSPEKCIELIPGVFKYLDEPIADASALPTYLLSYFTRKHVTVALGGDGADELFAGYPTFQADQLVRFYEATPRAMRRFLIEPLIRSLPVSHTYFSLDFRLKKFIEGVHVPSRYRHQHWLAAFNEEEIGVIASGPLRETAQSSPYDQLDTFFRENASKGEFHNDVLWSYLRTYCMDQVLAKVDRMSMAHGLEVRAPFLDHTIVEFVLNLPYEYKFRGMTGKYILKRLMSGRIPAKIINRRKKGFGIPIGRWLQKELLPLSHELLSREALEKSGMFNYRGVEKLLIEHESGAKDHRKKLWTLMAFQLWYNNWAR